MNTEDLERLIGQQEQRLVTSFRASEERTIKAIEESEKRTGRRLRCLEDKLLVNGGGVLGRVGRLEIELKMFRDVWGRHRGRTWDFVKLMLAAGLAVLGRELLV